MRRRMRKEWTRGDKRAGNVTRLIECLHSTHGLLGSPQQNKAKQNIIRRNQESVVCRLMVDKKSRIVSFITI